MNVIIKPMEIQHYDQVIALWQVAEGVGLSEADSPEGIAAFLARNPDLSFVACDGNRIVGAVLCGHDGRRGYIHHLAVASSHRRQGLGHALVEHCLAALNGQAIHKCHLFVFHENDKGVNFWMETGWTRRDELVMFSQHTSLV